MDTIQSHFQAILDLCTEREKNYQLEIHKLTKEIEELQKVPMSKILSKEISNQKVDVSISVGPFQKTSVFLSSRIVLDGIIKQEQSESIHTPKEIEKDKKNWRDE